MKIKLLTVALTIMTSFLLTAINLPETSAKSLPTCKVSKNNTDFFVEATSKTIKLKKGTLIAPVSFEMHQGLYVVKAKVGKKWVRGEINYEAIQCPN